MSHYWPLSYSDDVNTMRCDSEEYRYRERDFLRDVKVTVAQILAKKAKRKVGTIHEFSLTENAQGIYRYPSWSEAKDASINFLACERVRRYFIKRKRNARLVLVSSADVKWDLDGNTSQSVSKWRLVLTKRNSS